MSRPDHIACIQHTDAPGDGMPRLRSWCGRVCTMEWTFTSIDHAVYAVREGCRQVPCPECVAVITSLLNPKAQESS